MHLSELKIIQKISQAGNDFNFNGEILDLMGEALDYIEEHRMREIYNDKNNGICEVMLFPSELQSYTTIIITTVIVLNAFIEKRESLNDDDYDICNNLADRIMRLVDCLLRGTTGYITATQAVFEKRNKGGDNPLYASAMELNTRLKNTSLGTEKEMQDAMNTLQKFIEYDKNEIYYCAKVCGYNLAYNLEDKIK